MLKLEYLADGSPDCPLIRLYDFVPADIAALRAACLDVAEGREQELALHVQPWVCAIESCALVLSGGRRNKGVKAPRQSEPFVMQYESEGWLEVADKLEPFLLDTYGFQWLTNEGDINVLISRSGLW